METVSSEKIITVAASSVKAENEHLFISHSGKEYRFTWASLSAQLAKATPQQRANFTLSSSGYGMHWNEIDEDISIHALLK